MQSEGPQSSDFGDRGSRRAHYSDHRDVIAGSGDVHEVSPEDFRIYPSWKLSGWEVLRPLLNANLLRVDEF